MALLEIRKVSKYFGGLAALHDLDMDIYEGEKLGLIGPNGAGKTTLFNIICGFHKPTSGRVIFQGEDITGLRPDQIAGKGIARSFQTSTLFTEMTTFENVCTAFHMSYQRRPWEAFLHTPSARKEEEIIKQQAMEIVEFTGLGPHKDKRAKELSGGYQKTLGIAVALPAKPKLLLLDEPATFLSPDRVESIMKLIVRVQGTGTTVAIIEHNMKAIMDYCDRIVVLGYGGKLAEGLPQEIGENEEVIEAYLGAMD